MQSGIFRHSWTGRGSEKSCKETQRSNGFHKWPASQTVTLQQGKICPEPCTGKAYDMLRGSKRAGSNYTFSMDKEEAIRYSQREQANECMRLAVTTLPYWVLSVFSDWIFNSAMQHFWRTWKYESYPDLIPSSLYTEYLLWGSQTAFLLQKHIIQRCCFSTFVDPGCSKVAVVVIV